VSGEARALLEVCVDSVAGCAAAARGGAGRVELCADLVEGGVTPSLGTIEAARECTRLPLVVLVRPRGGDFVYDADELDVLRRDVRHARRAGADGVALGVLAPDGTVDRAATRELVELARPMAVTFHRAFDHALDPLRALEELAEIGVDRILSSGGAARAEAGLERLADLVRRAAGRVSILPAGGIRAHNVARVLAATRAREVHCSALAVAPSASLHHNEACPLTSPPSTSPRERRVTRSALVRAVVDAIDRARPAWAEGREKGPSEGAGRCG